MRRRIFIAINLPEKIKRELGFYQEKWPEIPARWTKPNNLHITLVFIGYVNDEELVEICKITKMVAGRNSPFFVNLRKISYGPLQLRPGQAPRMLWAVGEKSQEFSALKDDLEKSLLSSQEVSFFAEKREFSPHITLGRINQWQWRQIEPEERPTVEEEVDLSFPVDSIEVMESDLKKGGAKYTVLEIHKLGGG